MSGAGVLDEKHNLVIGPLASSNPTAARQEARLEAKRAQTLSIDMGYHWGQLDAAELLTHLP